MIIDPPPTFGDTTEFGPQSAPDQRPDAQQLLRQIENLRHSPEARMDRYRSQVLDRRMMVPVHIAWFCVCAFFVCVITGADQDVNLPSLGVTALLALLTLAGGDLYEIVRDAIENRIFCPKYDRASQPRPKFEIKDGLGPARFFIYVVVAPLVPATGLWVLNRYALVQLPDKQGLWSAAEGLLLLFGFFRLMKMPTSLRGILEPFKRIPSPDCN